MNTEILNRTNKKIHENQNIGQHIWFFNGDNYTRQYDVLPHVFSPAIFLGTEWLTHQILKRVSPQNTFIQIGCGIGVTSIQIALNKKNNVIHCSDINPHAVQNTKINAYKRYTTKIEIFESNLFEKIPQRQYDVIYWNYPFHPSNKQYSCLTVLEKAIRDPNYDILSKFLKQAKQYLSKSGIIYLGFSLTMGDFDLLKKKLDQHQYLFEIIAKMGENDKGTICLLKITEK